MTKPKTFKKIILDDLKAQGLLSIVHKVRSIQYRTFTGGDSVDVYTVNLTASERDTLERILGEYRQGTFNGMQDIYEYRDTKPTKERLAKFVSLNNKYSDDVVAKVKAKLRDEWDVVDDNSAQARRGMWYEQCVWRECQQLERL